MFQTVDINIVPTGDMPVVNVSQYDVNRIIRFCLLNDGETYTPTNFLKAEFIIRKVDGTLFTQETTILVSNVLELVTTEQMTACAGKNIGEIRLTFNDPDIAEDDVIISTLNFILEVERSPETGGIESESEIANLNGQIAAIVDEQLENYYTKSEIDDQISDIVAEQVTPIVADIVAEQVPPAVQAELGNYYTKDETDTYFYNKTETDTLLSGKADVSSLPDMTTYYTKTETDTLLSGKVSNSTLNDYYTKTQVDTLISGVGVDITTYINTPAAVQTFADGGDNIPLKSCEVAIVAQQASGTPSPSNPLSISGFSSVNVGNYAKYHRIIASSLTPQSQNGITITPKADGVFEITGTATGAVAINFVFDEFTVFSDDTRTININNDFASSAVTIKYNNGSTTIDTWTLTSINRTYTNFGLLSGKTLDNLTISIASGTTINGTLKTEFLVTNTGTTTPVSLGQTIYGGTADLVNGTGIKTHENIASYNGEAINEPWLCSEAPFVSGTTPPTGSQVVYPLSTPTAFTFTGANIPTLSGVNNVYADSGDVNALEYFNDKADDIAALITLMNRS